MDSRDGEGQWTQFLDTMSMSLMPLTSFLSNYFTNFLSFQHTAQYNVSDIGLIFSYNTQAQGITASFLFFLAFTFPFHI